MHRVPKRGLSRLGSRRPYGCASPADEDRRFTGYTKPAESLTPRTVAATSAGGRTSIADVSPGQPVTVSDVTSFSVALEDDLRQNARRGNACDGTVGSYGKFRMEEIFVENGGNQPI